MTSARLVGGDSATQSTPQDWWARQARSSAVLSLRGWIDVLRRTLQQIGEDRVTMVAGSVTYFALLSLVPGLSALVSVYGLFADPATVSNHITSLGRIVPQGGMQIINDQLSRLASQSSTTLGTALILSLAVALWSASSGVKTMFEAMNIAYGEREKRNFIVLNGVALLFTVGGVVGVLLLAAVAIVLPVVLGYLGLGDSFKWLIQIACYLVVLLLLLTGIAALYRWGPSRQGARWRWITPGAVLALVAILVMSILFSWYAGNFAHFDKTYGSLGGLIGLLTWMWLSITALVVGAELNAEAKRQTRTVGGGNPRGSFHAAVADTVGPTPGEHPSKAGFDGQSGEWRAGYLAALQRRPRRPASPGELAVMLPLALTLEAVLGRPRKP